MLPLEYPPWQTVYYHFRKWRLDGRLRQAHDRLRDAVRQAEGRDRNPSAAVIDSQVVKTTPVGGPERGYDGAKRLDGRKLWSFRFTTPPFRFRAVLTNGNRFSEQHLIELQVMVEEE